MKIKFVDIKKYGFVVEPRYYFYGWSKSARILARKSLVEALKKAGFVNYIAEWWHWSYDK